ncbi:similar to Saccharomyces cerevisiae YHR202W Putative protein of unknown function [Maudiozyma barnettii]|uniref:Putative 5'-nucleotidase C-terminal domain-containing protein n=1 Tax=Maudiozyma barnettii TaxID=61262 RepID=A0A8H2VFW4_9SACH|nr:hypothetical protein [Kazachstania barnettii]CAB4254429.1 similar to Saccharomyces cerevisiae YHR202W Putative protein of unknown function [Kazachstania barnettii]CAD1782369.1 similar to Saccharomyces cerevisiae YHR202W Putative protein of unknown function [Kazachstania barnettii]
MIVFKTFGLCTLFGLTTAQIQQNIQNSLSVHDEEPLLRGLKLGELNFIHTTDTHGWYGSHKAQSDYDADWGDFISFIQHFRNNRIHGNKLIKRDLLVIDTGDKHDGNGLTDATSPNGLEANEIFNSLDYDLLTLGNHELYSAERAVFEYYTTAMSYRFKDKYISSNVNFITATGDEVPFGNKWRYFVTPYTRHRILALSFIFNFKTPNSRAKVTPLVEEIKKEWFLQLINKYPSNKIDVLLVFGHLSATDPVEHEINYLYDVLRSFYPDTVIQFFGGHSHIRDFVKFDDRSTCLQSGRFSDTVGFISINNIKSKHSEPIFFRRYLDFNKRSFKFHAKTKHLSTKVGNYVSSKINVLRTILDLDHQYGIVPQTYYMMARPLDSESNIYYLFKSEILLSLNSSITDPAIGRMIMINTGAIRYDLYKGPFTKDSEYIVLPFENTWNYMILPLKIASRIEEFLNEYPYVMKMLSPPEVFQNNILIKKNEIDCPVVDKPDLSEGYTTVDDFGCDGDDTPHNTQILYNVPNVIQSNQLVSTNPDSLIHFIFVSFLTDDILQAVNSIGSDISPGFQNYTSVDVNIYGGQSAKQLLREYIIQISQTQDK